MTTSALVIKNLHISVANKEIIKGLNLIIAKGEVHAIMGPNGSGKSTLAYGLMGHPNYDIRNPTSEIRIKDKNINLEPEERAKLGLFLAFQNPVSVPGVRVSQFLKSAYNSLKGKSNRLTPLEFYRFLEKKAQILGMDKSFLERSLNDGFSGGEKKKLEMLQLLTLEPSFIIIDEIDTGLDIDALRIVSSTLNSLKKLQNKPGILIISHYQRIFNYLRPDFVHIMKNGRIVRTGDYTLVQTVEKKGYAPITN